MGMDKTIEKKKGIRPKHLLYLTALAILTYLIVIAVRSSGTSVYRADKEKLTIGEVTSGEFIDYISVTGLVEPISTIFLDAEESGKVEEIVTEMGEMVKKGDVIIRLRNSDLYLRIQESESTSAYHSNTLQNTILTMDQKKMDNKRQVIDWKYRVQTLKRAYEQNRTLYDKKLVAEEIFVRSMEDYELAKENYTIAIQRMEQDSVFREVQQSQIEERLESMERNMLLARKQLDNLNVKAPIDGQLGMLNAEIGQSINRGERIGQINVLTDFKVNAQIDEHYIDRVTPSLMATLDRQDEAFGLVVKKVYPEVRNGQFEVDLVFTGQKPTNIRIGQSYYLRLELGTPQQAVMIPRGGFFQSTGGQWIYVLSPDETFAVKRAIRTGRQNPQYYEIIEGLEPGEKVITSSYEVFGDNDRIEMR
jgi:HlyD family secretion protein